MDLVPHVVAYIAIGIFVVASLARIFYWSRMPLHVRWELYPVAHEGKRASYGGSYMEEVDWWKKPRETSFMGELKVMIPEILFLVALKEHNPGLWLRSFPFHLGIYLVIACTVLMLGTGVLAALSPSLAAGGTGTLLRLLIMACGWAGLILGILGALGLLLRRLTDSALRDFTSVADIINLVFFVVAFGVALATALLVDSDFSRVTAFASGLVTFGMVPMAGQGLQVLLPMLSVVLLGVLLAYIPLTHMSHFVGKFFAYHAIRWADEPNLPGGEYEEKIRQVLSHPVSWAGPHIRGDGKKTWAEVATEEQRR